MHRPISWFGACCLPLLLAFSALSGISPHAQSISAQTIEIDAAAPAHPFPHFWGKMFGSGRAILSLRDGYRNRPPRNETDHRFRTRPLSRDFPRVHRFIIQHRRSFRTDFLPGLDFLLNKRVDGLYESRAGLVDRNM